MSGSSVGGLSKESLLSLYRQMLLIRRFEERVIELFARGRLPGFVHLYIGEEAIAVGVCSALRGDDFITSTHRGHGHVIAKGGDVAKMMAEIYGKSTGYCKGKGGSLHITDMSVGMLGANGIVCGGVPIAVGAAYGSARIRGTDQVAVAFFGDGATGEGAFHEACNMASTWKLPAIFVCENNLYGVGTRLGRVAPTEDLIARASGYDMPAVSVDGNDVIAVREAAKEAVARAREGGGPSFLECKTWRHRAHFEGEDTSVYRNEDEHQRWLVKDPLKRFAQKLLGSEAITQEELDELDDSVQAEIDDAVSFSEESPDPAPEDALNDLYV